MRVTVHYMAQIKRSAGCSSESVDLPNPTSVQDFLSVLTMRHGAEFKALILDDAGRPRKSLLFFVGDEHANPAHPLKDGDSLTILAPMSGGQ